MNINPVRFIPSMWRSLFTDTRLQNRVRIFLKRQVVSDIDRG